jgi:hypothetical protein
MQNLYMLEFMKIGLTWLELLLLGLRELPIMMVCSSLMFAFLLNTREFHRYICYHLTPGLPLNFTILQPSSKILSVNRNLFNMHRKFVTVLVDLS